MNILVTGANGFIGKNLIWVLKEDKNNKIFSFDLNNSQQELDDYLSKADIVIHLAGVNRPENISEFNAGNKGFTESIAEKLLARFHQTGDAVPFLLSSSAQAKLDNPYGISKKAAEDLVFDYGETTKAAVYVYRFPNVFGKWCRPNYNSAVATFCHNIARNQPITINDRNTVMNLVYIDDVVAEIIKAVNNKPNRTGKYCEVAESYKTTLGHIADIIQSFPQNREDRFIPNMNDGLTKKLYSTYLSYLPADKFSYNLKMNIDDRGSFTEFVKTLDRGQVSVNVSKPGIAKGNHWHHTKTEKFLVVSGCGVINFRKLDSDDVISYDVSGDNLEVVDIPPGYTHNIVNTGNCDMITIMWANETFDPNNPDTFFMEV